MRERRIPSTLMLAVMLAGCLDGDEPPPLASPEQAVIVASQAVGRPLGQGGVGHDGQAGYRIALDTPGGRAGLEPSLALTYGSLRGDDLAGVGWSLDGLSMVHRCAKTLGRDGVNAAVRLDASDLFCVDGQPLRSTGGEYGASETRYRTEPDTFGEWASETTTGAGPGHFWVRARDGRYHVYGARSDSRVEGNARIAGPDGTAQAAGTRRVAWLLDQVRDRWNNTLTITYRQYPGGPDDLPLVVVDRIQYTGVLWDPNGNRNVWFDYEERPDPIVSYTGGMQERMGVRLKRIRMEAPRVVGGATAPVRSYELDYTRSPTTGRSLLAAVRECDAAGVCAPPTRFTYTEGEVNPQFTALPRTYVSDSAVTLQAADLNRDGYDDVVYPLAGGRLAARQAVPDPANPRFAGEVHGPGSSYWGKAIMADLESDGTVEVVVAPATGTGGSGGGDEDIPLPEEEEAELPPPPPNVFRFVAGAFEPVGHHAVSTFSPLLTDLGGDGLADELYVDDGRWHYLPAGAGSHAFDLQAMAGTPAPAYELAYATTADLDGDGAAELLLPRPHTGGGLPWRLDAFGPGGMRRTAIEFSRCNVFADINGDGLDDVVSLFGGIHVQINAGNGLFLPRQPAWTCAPGNPNCASPMFGQCDDADVLLDSRASHDVGMRVVDVDQDGREDVMLFAPGMDLAGFDPWAVGLRSRGDHQLEVFNSAARYRTPFTLAGSANVAILDANADGQFDVAHLATQVIEVGGEPRTEHYLAVQIQENQPADLLQRVDADAWGGLHGFTYTPGRRLAAPDASATCAYPIRCAVAEYPLVTREQVSQGQYLMDRYRHEYRGLRANVRREDPLGFTKHTVIDEAAGEHRTETTFDFSRELVNGRYRHARARTPWYVRQFWYLDADTPARQWRGEEVRVTDWDTRPTAWGRSFFTVPARTLARTWDGPWPQEPITPDAVVLSTVVATSSVDDFGNEVRGEVDRGAGFVETTERVIRNDTGRWLLGLVDEERVTRTTPLGATTRTHRFTYDPDRGVLLTATREPDSTGDERTAQWLQTTLGYTRGVNDRVTRTDALGRTRTELTAFDAPETMVPVTVTDALGHATTMTWDPGLGVPTQITDPNGAWVATDHDGFGRPRATRRADGSVTTTSYESLQADGTTFYPLAVRTSSNGGASRTTYHDQRGLAVRHDQRDADGVVRTVKTDHDPAGRLIRETRPFAPGAPVWSTWFSHDGLGRPTYTFQFGTNGVETTRTVYAGLVTDVVDAEGRVQRAQRDVAGNVIATSTFPGGAAGAAVTTSFAYGPAGLARVTDAAGNVVTLEHDRLGRPTATVDEDIGRRAVTYDAFDAVVAETDAMGVRTTYEYDAGGRRITRTAPDGIDRWVWDPAGPGGVGRLHRSTRGTLTREYAYDALGRMATETTRVQNRTFVMGVAYDAIGRVARTTYPQAAGESQAFAVESVYGAHGELVEARDARTGRALWTRGALSPAGELADAVLGNGLHVAREYEPGTGRLLRVASAGSGWTHDLRYTYDRSGNVKTRTDAGQGRTESFDHDGADRLVASAIAGVESRSYTYDALGNRTGGFDGLPGCTATHGAGPAGPHAVTSVTCPTGGATLAYDANGRLTARTGTGAMTATWTSFHKVLRLDLPTGRIDHTYDADQRLVRRQARANNGIPFLGSGIWSDTIHLGLYEERKNPNSTTDHVFHVTAGGQPVADRILSCPASGACTERWLYLHPDALGSIERTSDGAGALLESQSFTAFGRRRNANWSSTSATAPPFTRTGFTGHKDLAEAALVDMTGRLYDPSLHTFLSPDSLIPSAFHGPSWNRYSYVLNNPLRYVDPSGHLPLRRNFEMMLGPNLYSYAANSSFSLNGNPTLGALLFGFGAKEGGQGAILTQQLMMMASGAREGASAAMLSQNGLVAGVGAFIGGAGAWRTLERISRADGRGGGKAGGGRDAAFLMGHAGKERDEVEEWIGLAIAALATADRVVKLQQGATAVLVTAPAPAAAAGITAELAFAVAPLATSALAVAGAFATGFFAGSLVDDLTGNWLSATLENVTWLFSFDNYGGYTRPLLEHRFKDGGLSLPADALLRNGCRGGARFCL